jgi:hypothetical protein
VTETLVIDCTPGDAPAAPVASPDGTLTAWAWHRLKLLEGQRQTLHIERDEARARVVDLEEEAARLRAHLAAAGLALDGLTAPGDDPDSAEARADIEAVMKMHRRDRS